MNNQTQVAQTCAAGSHLAQLAFTIINESGDVAADLIKEDLSLKINNDLTPVTALDRQVATPLDLAILRKVQLESELLRFEMTNEKS